METKTFKDFFDKYIVIWIWSIFIGVNSALTYNIFSLYNPGKWEKLVIFIIPLYLLAIFMIVTSWFALLNFFKIKIADLLFGKHISLQNLLREKSLDDKEENKKEFERDIIDKKFENLEFSLEDRKMLSKPELDYLNSKLEHHIYKDKNAEHQLKIAFSFLIYGMLFRLAIPIVEMIYELFF